MIQQQMLGVEPLPFHIAQQAEAYQLGMLNHVYKPRISNPLAVLGIAAAIFLIPIVIFIIILMFDYVLTVLLIIPIFAIIYAVVGLINCGLRVYEFPHGLIKARGNRIELTRWEDVESVWQELKTNNTTYLVGGLLGALLFGGGTKMTYKIRRRDGAMLVIDSLLQNIETLGTTIQQEVAQAHLPQAIAALDGGQPLPFGPLVVSLQGITNNKGAILPWLQVRGVSVNKNLVTILQDGRAQKWVSTPLAKVPNVGVLTGLVDYAMRRAKSYAQ